MYIYIYTGGESLETPEKKQKLPGFGRYPQFCPKVRSFPSNQARYSLIEPTNPRAAPGGEDFWYLSMSPQMVFNERCLGFAMGSIRYPSPGILSTQELIDSANCRHCYAKQCCSMFVGLVLAYRRAIFQKPSFSLKTAFSRKIKT